jgi:ABC-type multidrug transport system permease subunit
MAQDMLEAGVILLVLAFVLGILQGVIATEEHRPWWWRWLARWGR